MTDEFGASGRRTAPLRFRDRSARSRRLLPPNHRSERLGQRRLLFRHPARGCLGLDALWQLAGFFLVWSDFQGRGRALGAGKVRFTGQVLPTAKLVTYQLDIKRVISRRLVLVIADGTMSVDGRKIYTAEDLRVGLFTSTDSF